MPNMDIVIEAMAAGNYPPAVRPRVQAGAQVADPPAKETIDLPGTGKNARPAITTITAPSGGGTAQRPARASNSQVEELQEELTQHAVEARNRHMEEARTQQMQVTMRNLRLAIFEPTGDVYGKIINVSSGEVLRTVPPEALLRTWARMQDYVGMILDAEG